MELTYKNKSLKELAQLALVEIYEEYKQHKGSENIYMGDIRNKLGLIEFDDRIFQLTDLLKEMGYINIDLKTSDGLAFVKLTPKAIVYLEETNDTSINSSGNRKDNIIFNFFDKIEKSQFNTNSQNITQNNSNVNPDILDKIIDVIKNTNEINISDKSDLLSDIAIIKNEVLKSKPEKSFILQRIELWSKFLPLIQYIPAVSDYIKHL